MTAAVIWIVAADETRSAIALLVFGLFALPVGWV